MRNADKLSVVCPNCNNELPLDSEFCQYCGKAIHNVKQVPTENIRAKEKEKVKPKVKKEKKKKDTKRIKKVVKRSILISLSSICALALIAMALIGFVIPGIRYNKAVKLLKEEDYKQAAYVFEDVCDIGGGSNFYYDLSKKGIRACEYGMYSKTYEEALSQIELGEYSKAIGILISYRNQHGETYNSSNYYELYDIINKDIDTLYETYKFEMFKNLNVGDKVYFGKDRFDIYGYYIEDLSETLKYKGIIEWRVLDIQEGKALVISENALYRMEYGGYKGWESCPLRKWLNNEFFNSVFTDDEQAAIPTVTVSADVPSYVDIPEVATQDKIFLLSDDELSNAPNRDDSFWRRSGECEYTYSTGGRGIQIDPELAKKIKYDNWRDNIYEKHSVRPAMWIDLSKL